DPICTRLPGPPGACTRPGAPALRTVGFGAVSLPVPGLVARAERPITGIKNALTRQTATILRWVGASALYIDQFIGSSASLLFVRLLFFNQCLQRLSGSLP